MVLKLIGLVVLCTLANANANNKGSQVNCNWAHGVGTCKWIYACESYIKNEVAFKDLRRCSSGDSVPRMCCPISTHTHIQTIKAPPMGIAQGTNTNPPERRSNTTVTTVCNATSKTGNCNENSYCVSKLGNGICKRGENCEPYVNYKKPQWEFTRCNYDTICCVSTETEAADTNPQISRNQFVSTTKRTTSTAPTIAPHGSRLNWGPAPSVPSSSTIGNSCNTIQWNGNCYEGNSCTSPSGNGTCALLTRCEPGQIQNSINHCSHNLICCLSIRQSSSKTTPEINRSMFSGTSNTQHSVPLRPNTENTDTRATDVGKMCNNLSGPGTCKYISECVAYMQRKIQFSDMMRCGIQTYCCPNSVDTRPKPMITTPKPKSVAGTRCSIFPYASGICTVLHQCQSYLQGTVKNETLNRCLDTSNPRSDLVCCPQVTSTSAKPTIVSTTTMRAVAIANPEPQVRPSEKACEIYKATNPKRLLTHMPGVMDARNGEFPHVGIVMGSGSGGGSSLRLYCGAALIAKRFALTAANCARSLPEEAVVRFGSVETSPIKTIDQRLVAKIKNIWLQDDNKDTEDYHDLAVLEFLKDIQLTSSVHPACLRVAEEDLPRSVNLYVNGWTTNDATNNYRSPVLYASAVNTASLIGCNFTHYSLGVSRRFISGVQLGQYCARNSNREQCDGDSGFPLMTDTNGQFEIIGILSLEFGCSSTLPSIYTRVAYYIDWIEDIVWPKGTQNV